MLGLLTISCVKWYFLSHGASLCINQLRSNLRNGFLWGLGLDLTRWLILFIITIFFYNNIYLRKTIMTHDPLNNRFFISLANYARTCHAKCSRNFRIFNWSKWHEKCLQKWLYRFFMGGSGRFERVCVGFYSRYEDCHMHRVGCYSLYVGCSCAMWDIYSSVVVVVGAMGAFVGAW